MSGPSHRASMSKAIALCGAFALFATPAFPAASTEFLTPPQRTADFTSFCAFVADNYAYFDRKSTDWPRACAYYAPLAERASTRDEFIHVLERALGELYDHHAHLGTNTASSPRLVPSQTDVVAAWRDDHVIVTAVRENSAAERTGLRAGNEILAINGVPVMAATAAIAPIFVAPHDEAARTWALQVALAGTHDRNEMRLLIRSGAQRRQLRYAPSVTSASAPLSSRVIHRTGYIRINNSLGDSALVPAFEAALQAMSNMPPSAKEGTPSARTPPGSNLQALIIDLRDTPSGGNSTVARGLMGQLIDRTLPYQRHELIAEFRSTGIHRIWVEYVAPRQPAFLQPVVVLVGPWTGSMGEGLAIGLNATRNAPVVGRPMAHLLGALGELELANSRIVVRIATEQLFHINGTPREDFLPSAQPPPSAFADDDDPELAATLVLATQLAAHADRLKPAHTELQSR